MEERDIAAAFASAQRWGKVISVLFVVIAVQCAVVAGLHCVGCVTALMESRTFLAAVQFPGMLGWVAFVAASLICALTTWNLGKGISPFTTKTHRRFLVCAILLWVYALVDFVWLPLLEQVGTLMQMQEFSFSVVEHGLDMGFNFNIGAVFAAAVLTLIASLVHYASLLQQQADELF